MASNGAWQINSTFNPYDQNFLLTLPDGHTPYPAAFQDVLQLNSLVVSQAIVYGTQIGLTSLLFIILLLMTKRDKRRSAVFLLNVLALVLIFVRNILSCVQLNTIFYNFYNWELHWYPPSPATSHAMNISATSEIFNVIVDAAIYGSLVLQVHIVCCTLGRLLKMGIIGVSGTVALAALAVRFLLAVFNIKYAIFGVNHLQESEFDWIERIASADNIVSVTAIALFSSIFVSKLAFAIHLRRKLNMKQFGPMQIIFVMGCQTMFVPCKYTPSCFKNNFPPAQADSMFRQ